MLWGVAAGVMLSVMYGPYDAQTGKHLVTLTENDFYNGLQRTAWGIGLSYIIISCSLGQGGKIWYDADDHTLTFHPAYNFCREIPTHVR